MTKAKIKLVCWADMAIPVPDWAEWMAQDWDGEWWVYENKPVVDAGMRWNSSKPFVDADMRWNTSKKCLRLMSDAISRNIPRPEPGHWTTQLYDFVEMES
jgi:hypothetical protein